MSAEVVGLWWTYMKTCLYDSNAYEKRLKISKSCERFSDQVVVTGYPKAIPMLGQCVTSEPAPKRSRYLALQPGFSAQD